MCSPAPFGCGQIGSTLMGSTLINSIAKKCIIKGFSEIVVGEIVVKSPCK